MIVDANVLLYAVDSGSSFHEASKSWLERALNGSSRVGLPWNSLCAFVRISTHPRASADPLGVEEAWGFVQDWLDAEAVWIPGPTARHAEVLRDLLVEGDLRGNLVTDAHLAALAIEHGVGVCSFDSDFARFPKLEWVNPLSSR
ncbi:type II toxin-antitoxin system VapC family toxin [Planomonospora sp. ID91781]|jgi:toxin-antitoxin system PIN domain toxin|uniref:type II toxin-antitoxin system VapC family toxin n=1 Tax=Planomonospora TaxID=1998 RepID=UPI0016717E8B|nr:MULTISPECIES: type II toxin-antitoxin system VapC family toxin [Planomonospora]MBG0825428.1 type II toxin-antitoxin system VapC family toxin [Planomonospora sp. ID91781]GGL35079.1 ribonuclease VapC [Planomonospora parontospora subsp. antibiotica]GII17252.1 ribonuclease VapC37 [Planomonospora parontospora subsp. antibiotica]